MERLCRNGSSLPPEEWGDGLFVDCRNEFAYEGYIGELLDFIREHQLLRKELWERFIEPFRTAADGDGGWRGEFWGKMMRGACFVLSAKRDERLYAILKRSVAEMIGSADTTGRISSYPVSREMTSWDLWCRKYVMLGMQYFFELCDDEAFRQEIIASLLRQLDAITAKVGDREKGLIPITETGNPWRGLNSSSILEPVMRLYTMTKEPRCLAFAEHIVSCGGTSVENLFRLAREDRLLPYQYPVTKAYEMISCFEGLLEYSLATGEESCRESVLRFAERLLESDFTVIGSGGCAGEMFDHSTVRQANTTNSAVKQETCVTVTYMKFFLRMLLLTGDPKYADAFERSFFNAYRGALNTENALDPVLRRFETWVKEPLPFDSYSPLTAGRRGNGIGGLMELTGGHYYGCCAGIGPAGAGLLSKLQLLTRKGCLVMNLYLPGQVTGFSPSGRRVTIRTETEYPKTGVIRITLQPEEEGERFALLLRNPAWSERTTVTVNGEPLPASDGYLRVERAWKRGDTILLTLDLRIRVLHPIPYGHQVIMTKVDWGHDYIVPVYDREDPKAKYHIALQRGPVMLAADSRLERREAIPPVREDAEGFAEGKLTDRIPFPHLVGAEITLADGSHLTAVDYGSAGKRWNSDRAAVWIMTEQPGGGGAEQERKDGV